MKVGLLVTTGLEDTSESFGLATADLMFALISNEELNHNDDECLSSN